MVEGVVEEGGGSGEGRGGRGGGSGGGSGGSGGEREWGDPPEGGVGVGGSLWGPHPLATGPGARYIVVSCWR